MHFKKRVIIIPLALAASLLLYFFLTCRSFSATAGIDLQKIDRIEVRADWGQSKTITSKSDITAVIGYLDSYRYHRNFFASPSSGYWYDFTFYSGSDKKADFMMASDAQINDRQYFAIGGIDTARISNIVGLTPPQNGNT